ncbi:hypothetical protein BGX27_000311 [Mortierella sp. AM989]|nr:hypothetical protein BGX27_000311 [Mortierella sp. AM989]
MSNNSAPIYAAKSTIRSLKNFSKGYTDMQAKVRTATSNDPWGPTGSQMNELADATYNQQAFLEIMEILDKRMNDKGKNWRHVFKALTVLDYLLHVGSENVVRYARDNLYVVKTLKEFQYIDEDGKDQGSNVRAKVKDIMSLLGDEARLREARKSRSSMRDRMTGRAPRDGLNDGTPTYERPGAEEEDRDLQKALRESRRLAREAQGESSDDDLKKALALSKKEAQDRQENMEKYNKLSDDWDNRSNGSNERQEQQQDSNNAFVGNGQGFDNNFEENNFLQSQPTGFNNPYMQFQQQHMLQQQQQQQQQQLEQQQLQQQLEQQQLQQQYLQQQQLQQLQQQQLAYLNTMNNPYQQQLMPQMTGAPSIGSNNPFSTSNIQKAQANQPFPDSYRINASNFASNNNASNFASNNNGNNGFSSNNNGFNSNNNGFNSGINSTSNSSSNNLNSNTSSLGDLAFLQGTMTNTTPVPSQTAVKKAANPNDEKYANLAMALSNREDGMDTFGNTGQLRLPSHHTQGAPVALASHITGASNPFQRSHLNNGGGNLSSNNLIDAGNGAGSNGTNNPFQGISQAGGFNAGGFVPSGGMTGSFGGNNGNLF